MHTCSRHRLYQFHVECPTIQDFNWLRSTVISDPAVDYCIFQVCGTLNVPDDEISFIDVIFGHIRFKNAKTPVAAAKYMSPIISRGETFEDINKLPDNLPDEVSYEWLDAISPVLSKSAMTYKQLLSHYKHGPPSGTVSLLYSFGSKGVIDPGVPLTHEDV